MTAPPLTVGFSTSSDPGAWWSLNCFLATHAHLRERMEFVIIDNSRERCRTSREFERHVASNHKRVRYIRDPGPPSSCLYKDRLFREAEGEIVVCTDSHVALSAQAVDAVLRYFCDRPDSRDMLTGVIYHAAHRLHGAGEAVYTWENHPQPRGSEIHHGIYCRGEHIGCWVNDPRAAGTEPWEVQLNGTWFFAMRRAAWPGFHPFFYGFGGNELYLCEMVRRRGGKVLCHPKCAGLHNFSHGHGRGYVPHARDKIRNYLVTGLELRRRDIYRAALDYFGMLYPQVVEHAEDEARRIYEDQYATLYGLWQSHGGNRAGAAPRPLINELAKIPPDSRTLEFGSGLSTLLFDKLGTRHLALENSRTWIDRLRPLLFSPTLTLQETPLDGGWYAWKPNGEQYDFILIDGPLSTQGDRGGVSAALPQILAPGAVIYIDDTHRGPDAALSDAICEKLGYARERKTHGMRAFDVLKARV